MSVLPLNCSNTFSSVMLLRSRELALCKIVELPLIVELVIDKEVVEAGKGLAVKELRSGTPLTLLEALLDAALDRDLLLILACLASLLWRARGGAADRGTWAMGGAALSRAANPFKLMAAKRNDPELFCEVCEEQFDYPCRLRRHLATDRHKMFSEALEINRGLESEDLIIAPQLDIHNGSQGPDSLSELFLPSYESYQVLM